MILGNWFCPAVQNSLNYVLVFTIGLTVGWSCFSKLGSNNFLQMHFLHLTVHFIMKVRSWYKISPGCTALCFVHRALILQVMGHSFHNCFSFYSFCLEKTSWRFLSVGKRGGSMKEELRLKAAEAVISGCFFSSHQHSQ